MLTTFALLALLLVAEQCNHQRAIAAEARPYYRD